MSFEADAGSDPRDLVPLQGRDGLPLEVPEMEATAL